MIDPGTLSQLETHADIHRPLFVCDVDEVILHLVAPFEQLLDERGRELPKRTIRLTGNVFSKKDGGEIAFMDDAPHHLESIRLHTRATHLVHFMANGEARDMIGKLDGCIDIDRRLSVAGNTVRTA